MSQTCPSCAAPASGRFCPQCGVAIDAICRECQNPLPAGARFCNQCGVTVAAALAATVAAKTQPLPWAVAGLAVVALAGVLIVPRMKEDPAAAAPVAPFAQQQGAADGQDPRSIDLNSMTPREAADRLFNRVMTALSNGNADEARQFAPMAIQAYGMVKERDGDLHYHLGELYHVQGDLASARAQADTLLAGNPNHLLGLFGAAKAEQARGNVDEAETLYQKFVNAYGEEMTRDLPEYQEHIQGLPAMRAEAQRALAPAQ
jgi:tetratricopeptide (TPR) repeat protein